MREHTIPAKNTVTLQVDIAVEGLLFDMDGVLVTSTQSDERCWTRWAAHHNLSETFDLRGTHGRRAIDTLREHFPNLTVNQARAHIAQLDSYIEEEEGPGVIAYPGVVALLASIPPHRWTVVTSASEKIMRTRLSAAGIVPPAHTVGGDTVTMGKPHPEGYLRGAAILTRKPQDCLVIEDAPTGIKAGKAAGCRVLAVATSHRPDELRTADWVIASIDQLKVSKGAGASTLNLRFPAIQPPTTE
jgi:sugar-phosphatase